MEEQRYYSTKEVLDFLGIRREFENGKQFPFWIKDKDILLNMPTIIIPREGIEKTILSGLRDCNIEGRLYEIKMIIEIPYFIKNRNEGDFGIIHKNVSLTFRGDKTWKYGDINRNIYEVCYTIQKYGTATNDFYIINNEFANDFMSYCVINNQWGLGSTTVSSTLTETYIKGENKIEK